MWTCMFWHSCHWSLWVSVNSQFEPSLLKHITLKVNYPWYPYILSHIIFLPKTNAAAFPKAVSFTGSGSPSRDVCFPSINSLQLSFLHHAALIRLNWLLKTSLKQWVSCFYSLWVTHPLFFQTWYSSVLYWVWIWHSFVVSCKLVPFGAHRIVVCLCFTAQRTVQSYF